VCRSGRNFRTHRTQSTEAAAAAHLYRDLATYGPATLDARQDLRRYVDSVVEDEWPLLSNGQSSARTDIALFRLYDAMGHMRPADTRGGTIYTAAFDNLNELVALRRDRLIHSESGNAGDPLDRGACPIRRRSSRAARTS
jgi:hypothetical protein